MATGEVSSLQKFRRSVDKVMRQASVSRIKDKINHLESDRHPFQRHAKNRTVKIVDPRDDISSRENSLLGDHFLEAMTQGDLTKRLSSLGGLQNLPPHIDNSRAQSAAETNGKRPGWNRLTREKTFPGENRNKNYPTNLINWAMSVASGNSRGSGESWDEESNGSAMNFLLRRYATVGDVQTKNKHKTRAREKIKKKLSLPLDRLGRIATLRQNVRFIEGKFRSMLHKQRAIAVEDREDITRSRLSNGPQPEYWPSRFQRPGEALFFFKSRTRMIVICMRMIRMVMDLNKNNSWEKELKTFVDMSLDVGENIYTEPSQINEGLQFDKNEYKANKEAIDRTNFVLHSRGRLKYRHLLGAQLLHSDKIFHCTAFSQVCISTNKISLSSDVRTILSLRPEARTHEMCKQVMLGLQTLQSLSEYPLDTQEQLCRVAWFQQVPSRKYIIRQGHRPEAFYFILSGLAVVKKIESDEQTGEEQTRVVARLTRGQSFGELGLIFKTPRNATVESGTAMDLLVVGKQDFLKIFMHNVKPGEDPDHIAFLKQQPILRHWPFECLKEDPGSCLINYFKRGTLITESGKDSEWIYFIKSGSCVALKRLKAVTPRTRHQLRTKMPEKEEFQLQLPIISSKLNIHKESLRTQQLHPELYRSVTEYYDGVRKDAEQTLQDARKKQSAPTTRSKSRAKSLNAGELLIPEVADNQGSSITSQPYFHRTPPTEDMCSMSLPPIQPRHIAGPAVSRSKFVYLSKRMDKGNFTIPTSTNLHRAFREKVMDIEDPIPTSRDDKEDVFVTVEKLNSRDIFGMNTVSFSGEDTPDQDIPEVSLVSKGAEIVMLSKKMFLKHAEERVKLCVQELIAPYQQDAQLQENLQIKADWNVYRNEVLMDVMFTNYALKNCMTNLV